MNLLQGHPLLHIEVLKYVCHHTIINHSLKLVFSFILDDGNTIEDDVHLRFHGDQTPDVSPLRGSVGPHASTPVLQNIMSMEEDDTSDQELVNFCLV